MASPSLDRLACRISEETRLARLARHPRARIAHFMLADAYRALVNRMLLDDRAEAVDQPKCGSPGAASARYLAGSTGPDKTGFLADQSA